jgi:hypothetical protein
MKEEAEVEEGSGGGDERRGRNLLVRAAVMGVVTMASVYLLR